MEIDITALLAVSDDESPDLTELLEAVEAASSQDQTAWLTDKGKRIAAIVPVDVAEYHDTMIADVLATPVSGPLADRRKALRKRLDDLNAPALADVIGTDPGVLRQWENLVAMAAAGLRSGRI